MFTEEMEKVNNVYKKPNMKRSSVWKNNFLKSFASKIAKNRKIAMKNTCGGTEFSYVFL